MRFKRKLQQRVGIDMTPMIDCVFLLLIFFMFTSSIIVVQDQGIQVNLPHAKSSDAQPERDLVISIGSDNVLYLNDVRIEKRDLYDRLRQTYGQDGRNFVVIRADEVIEYGVLVEVMDIARLAGVYNVSLSTKR
jgi:biopolymer transport protein ExbD